MKSIISKQTVLITGGAGFIGSHLTQKLLKLNLNPHLILKSSTNTWRLQDIIDKVNIHTINLLDKNSITKLVFRINPKYIFHLATYSAYRNQTDVEQMVDVNIRGTLNLLLASKTINYEIFVNTGSSSEYGFKKNPMRENDTLVPISFYAATKSSATLISQVFSKEYKKPIVTIRPFSVYGPYEENDRFIPTIIRSIIQKSPKKITSGSQRRDFIYIEDLIDLYLKTMNNGKKLRGEIFNAGTGKEYTNDEVVETLFRVSNLKVPIKKGSFPKRIWDFPHWVADNSKSQKLLNWETKHTLEDGLKKTYLWFKKSGLFDNG